MYSIVSILATIIGSVIMGGIVGLIPFFIANKKGFNNMGLVCMCLCILGNFLYGLYLSVPVCLVSVIVILVRKKNDNPTDKNPYNYQSAGNPQMNGNPQSAGNPQMNVNPQSAGNPQMSGNPQSAGNPQMNGNTQSAGNVGNRDVFCSYCGTRNDSGTAYCTNCGHRMDA